MNLIDGLNYLDQLKHFVHTSISIQHNVQQNEQVEGSEQDEHFEQAKVCEKAEHIEQIGDPLALNDIFEEDENVVDTEDLLEVKEEISDEGNVMLLNDQIIFIKSRGAMFKPNWKSPVITNFPFFCRLSFTR